jgi:RNA polymerase sigma factor (sigma-70 family)
MLYQVGAVGGLDDCELLGQFTTRDGAAAQLAFGAIVHRHGAMVLAVCERVLRDEHAAEDAFQATFLVLALKAGTLRKPESLASWLHGVATRISRRARTSAHRRAERERALKSSGVGSAGADEIDLVELRSVLDEEVGRLPAAYRRAVVLCYLEGKRQEDAARELGWTKGTVSGRLARAKEILRARLIRRGFAPSAGLVGLLLSDATVSAAVPASLAEGAVRCASSAVLGRGEGIAASSAVLGLARNAVRAMLLAKVKPIAAALVLLVAFAAALVQTGASTALPGHDQSGAPGASGAAVGLASAGQAPAPGAEAKSKAARNLKLEVVTGPDNATLPGAVVWAQVHSNPARIWQGKTDDEGRCSIALEGGTPSFLKVVVVHPGFVPVELEWDGDEPIPESCTVALERGVPMGGTVHDAQRRPVAGARVHLVIRSAPPRRGRERYAGPDCEVAGAVTDALGRWQSSALPASAAPGQRLELVTIHPDHVALKQNVTSGDLRALAVDGVMKNGRALSGKVTSPTGRPVAGATVVIQSRSDRATIRRLQTDPDGRFETGPCIDPETGEFTLVVQADGFAASPHLLLVPAEIPNQLIQLSPRRPLHGRVVDAAGRPVRGATVMSPREFGFAGLDWAAETDPDGRFVWYEAPTRGSYVLSVAKPPFRRIIGRMVPGGSEEITLTLHRPQRLHGTVTEADTGRPIEKFDLIYGWGPHRTGWTPDWQWSTRHSCTGGKFDLTGSDSEQEIYRSIRIEADGYVPVEFMRFHDSLEDVVHDFKLKKATPLVGIVRGPDGRPLAGVDVALSGVGYDAPIGNGRLRDGSGRGQTSRVRTGPDGRYEFRSQGHRVGVVAVHDTGIAISTADERGASSDLTLAAWGRIEGVVKIGNQPSVRETVAGWLLTPYYSDRIGCDATTDDAGRFVLERVAPGRTAVVRRVDNPDKQGWTYSHAVYVDVKPGQTVRVQVGGTGRRVVGRLAIPSGVTLKHFTLGEGVLALPQRELPTPDEYLELDSEHRAAWWQAFSRTAEGRAEIEDRERRYAVQLRGDGEFRIDDVPAGRYVLKLPFEGLSRGAREGRQAFARCEVVVPEMAGGRTDEPLDIGAIPLEVFPFHEPKAGDRAPTIAARAPDGPGLDLAPWRGKFVLLHFWSGRPEDAAVVPFLKAAYDAFGRDPRFVMIGLIADETPGPVLRYAALRGLRWEARSIGSTYDPNPIEAAFGVWFPPAAFLIGPDGRILGKDLEGEAIKQAVAKALR